MDFSSFCFHYRIRWSIRFTHMININPIGLTPTFYIIKASPLFAMHISQSYSHHLLYLVHSPLYDIFIQKMRYIAVDIPHILIVLFICCVLITQSRTHYYMSLERIWIVIFEKKRNIICSMFSSQWLYTQYQQLTKMTYYTVLVSLKKQRVNIYIGG